MPRRYTNAEVMSMLKQFVGTFKTQAEAAKKIGVSEGYLSKVLSGEKPLQRSKKILSVLHLDPKIYYEPEDEK